MIRKCTEALTFQLGHFFKSFFFLHCTFRFFQFFQLTLSHFLFLRKERKEKLIQSKISALQISNHSCLTSSITACSCAMKLSCPSSSSLIDEEITSNVFRNLTSFLQTCNVNYLCHCTVERNSCLQDVLFESPLIQKPNRRGEGKRERNRTLFVLEKTSRTLRVSL